MIKYLMLILGAVITALFTLLGIKNKKIKKVEEELIEKNLNIALENFKNEVRKELDLTATVGEQKTNEKIVEVKKDTEKKLSDESINYNDLIKEWNDEKK